MIDLGVVTPMCVCGSIAWVVEWVIFDEDYNIGAYSLNMKCLECNSLGITPTPIDHPDYEPGV